MIQKQELFTHIENYCKELKLPAMGRNFSEEIAEASQKNYSYEQFLHQLLQQESDLKRENGKKSRIRVANFPAKKHLKDLVAEELPEDARK